MRACLPFPSPALVDQLVPQINSRKEKQVLTNFLFGAGSAPSAREQTNTGEVKITIASKGAHRATQTQTDEISYAWQGAIGFIFKDNSHITT